MSNKLIKKRFFGTEEMSKIVVITPISEMYDKLLISPDSIKLLNETRGWWPSRKVLIGNKEISCLKVPQGYAVIDAIGCLDASDKVLFVGYAGGNSEKVDIGDIICATEAIFGDLSAPGAKLYNHPNVHHGKIMLAHTFAEQDQMFINRVKANDVSGVDMETFYVYSACNKANIEAISFLIVTDLIDKKPFYMTSKQDYARVQDSYKTLEDLVINAVS